MIPTMLIAGFVAGMLPGRWTLPGVAWLGLGWVALLMTDGVVSGVSDAGSAFLFGIANAAVGACRHAGITIDERFGQSMAQKIALDAFEIVEHTF